MTTTYRPHPVLWRALCLFEAMRAAGVPAEFIHLGMSDGEVALAAFTGVYGEGFVCPCGEVPEGWSDDSLAAAWAEAAHWWATTDTPPDEVELGTALWIHVQANKVRWRMPEVH